MTPDPSKPWRDRAARMRELSETMDDPIIRENLLLAAQEFDQKAVEADRREQEVKAHLLS
jgi:hypothetical protein